VDSIADLQKLAPLLGQKGYSDADIVAIFNGNWQRKLEQVLPVSA
jgi:microsomal dipeptidase-like Zn-dependent dipeptidase